jgi:hypothetical protein
MDDQLVKTLLSTIPQLDRAGPSGTILHAPPLKEAIYFITEHVQYYLGEDSTIPSSLVQAEIDLFDKLSDSFAIGIDPDHHDADLVDAWIAHHD